jgi:hypothetical protein
VYTNNELSHAEFEWSKFETRNRLLGADIAKVPTDVIKTFNTDDSPRKGFRSNHRRRVAPLCPSLIKAAKFK